MKCQHTMEDLIALTEQMANDGNKPWCIGLGSGDATGWPLDRLDGRYYVKNT